MSVAMAFAIFELMVGDLAGGETPFFLACVIAILRVDPREPTLLRVVVGSFRIDAAHDLPHPRMKRRARPKVVVPHPLSGTLEREVPAAFGLGDRCVGLLLPVDIDDLDDQVERRCGVFPPHRGRRGEAPEGAAVDPAIEAFGAIAVDLAADQGRDLFARAVDHPRSDNISRTETDALGPRTAEHVGKGLIGIDNTTLRVDQRHADRRVLHDAAKYLPALREGDEFPGGNGLRLRHHIGPRWR